MVTRRRFVCGTAAAFSFSGAALPHAAAQSRPRVPIADMHFHSFFGQSIYHSRPVGAALASGGATLVAWALSGDALWFDTKARFAQTGTPSTAEALGWFQRELGRIVAHVTSQGLKIVRTAADVERAVRGEPHIVLAVEGAPFLDHPSKVQIAFDAGVRHIQPFHFIQSPLGQFQTAPERLTGQNSGLTGLGREIVAECNRLGILLDTAHTSPATLDDCLKASRAPIVWSHSSVARPTQSTDKGLIWQRRRLTLTQARAIAAQGGVVGLWAQSDDVGTSPDSYGARALELAEAIGFDHVGFGTDLNGLGTRAAITTYAELRTVVDGWQRDGLDERRLRKIAIENYARVLKAALQART